LFKTKIVFGEADELVVAESQVITGFAFNDPIVISSYPWQQAVEDGILQRAEDFMEGFRPGWADAPVLITTNLLTDIQHDASKTERSINQINKKIARSINSIWNEFVGWRDYVYETLAEEDRMFVTERFDKTIFVIEDGVVITLLLADDW
jgi:hypothetical protein